MSKSVKLCLVLVALLLSASVTVNAQATAGAISGTVSDEQQGMVAGAKVTARNLGTNEARAATTDSEGRYRLPGLTVGHYEVTIEARGFAKVVRSGVELLLNQDAVISVALRPSAVEEVIAVTENASLLNTSNAEVSTRFDNKRLSELPLAPNRNVINVALSAAGQLTFSQTTS